MVCADAVHVLQTLASDEGACKKSVISTSACLSAVLSVAQQHSRLGLAQGFRSTCMLLCSESSSKLSNFAGSIAQYCSYSFA